MAILISGQSIYYIDSVGILYGNYFTGDYGYGKIGRNFTHGYYGLFHLRS